VDCRFEVVEELELEGYQIYAVEKWYVVPWFHPAPEVNHFSRVVERTRPITALTVYTGDPKHKVCPTNVTFSAIFFHDSRKIAVTALSPASSLTHHEAQLEWEKAVQVLRRDDARPREVHSLFLVGLLVSPSPFKTERGTLMVTSLANFRSDFTIVQIPDGNYLYAREQLWTNINLLRMGCSGRSALTLQKPG